MFGRPFFLIYIIKGVVLHKVKSLIENKKYKRSAGTQARVMTLSAFYTSNLEFMLSSCILFFVNCIGLIMK